MMSPLLRAGLRKDFRDNYKGFAKEWPGFLKSGSMDGPEIQATTMSGLPRQARLGELEPFLILDPAIAPIVTYSDTIYGLGFAVSKEMLKDDKYGKARQSAKWLGRSVNLTQEYEAADLLDDAFAGNVFTGFNGEPLISATHTMVGGAGTWSNLVPGNPALTIAGLQAAFELGEATLDANGDPTPVRIDNLIIGPADEWAAIQLLQNPNEPFTANNNINALRKKKQLHYTVSHYMDNTDRKWFAVDNDMNDAHLLFRENPSFPDWYEEMVRAHYFASYQRFLVYFYDPRGWIGSNPP